MTSSIYHLKYLKYKQKYNLLKDMNGAGKVGSLLYADQSDPSIGCMVTYPKQIIGNGSFAEIIKGNNCAVKQHENEL
jgi:hypothetical protein